MNTEQLTALRTDMRAWLLAHWDPSLSLHEWRALLADSGFGCPTFPRDWHGLGLSSEATTIVQEELERIGAPGLAEGSGMRLAAPTLLDHGSRDLLHGLLKRTIIGELRWCQLFSEPGAGSDLAGLTTRATRDGDEWIVNGQKLWCTSADHAHYGMLLARTDWEAPKHQGITYFAIPMNQPGIDVRPLRQMNGYSSFNEVFFTDARVAHANVVGEANDGWRVALTTLAHERTLRFEQAPERLDDGRAWAEANAERAEAMRPYTWYPARTGRADLLLERARATNRGQDPVVRQEVARVHALAQAVDWTARRADVARALGHPPGPEASVRKLATTRLAREAARVHSMIAGAQVMLWEQGSDLDSAAEIALAVPAASIAAGTDEIQRTIIGERVLGLPKEPAVDRGVPFLQVLTNEPR